LKLSQLSYDDCEFIFELVNEASFMRYIGDKGVRTLDDAHDYLKDGPIGSYERHGFGLFLVSLQVDDTPLGICGLVKREEFEHPDLGFAFLKRYWANGYALESTRAVLDFGAGVLKLQRIIAMVDHDNRRSVELLSKLGFSFESMVRMPGETKDICMYARHFV
jgi:RimJ/RimL family protein N-acetyltransferase